MKIGTEHSADMTQPITNYGVSYTVNVLMESNSVSDGHYITLNEELYLIYIYKISISLFSSEIFSHLFSVYYSVPKILFKFIYIYKSIKCIKNLFKLKRSPRTEIYFTMFCTPHNM
jgi:hypothetical protein